jgi:hypothetical protein
VVAISRQKILNYPSSSTERSMTRGSVWTAVEK